MSCAGWNFCRSPEVRYIAPSGPKAMRCEKWPLPLTLGAWRQIDLEALQCRGTPPLRASRAIADHRAAGAARARLDIAQVDAVLRADDDIAEPALPGDLGLGTPATARLGR